MPAVFFSVKCADGMPVIDTVALAHEFLSAYMTGAPVAVPPSARNEGFDLNSAYAVEAEFARLRTQSGRHIVGRKVGYASKAVWRVLKLETLVWAHMYDDTVHHASAGVAELALPCYRSPKIEPEIVFCLKDPLATGGLDAAAILGSVDWLAIGFEIIDCPYLDWQFQPADFVAAFGLHLRLVVGQPLLVDAAIIPALVDELAGFKLRLSKDGQFVEEGSGKNCLRSPALCLAELAGAVALRPGAAPLASGELVSSGTLTNGHPVAGGETWQADAIGLPLSGLKLHLK
jgi:2-oxo-3-hexenedioate decarboxylase